MPIFVNYKYAYTFDSAIILLKNSSKYFICLLFFAIDFLKIARRQPYFYKNTERMIFALSNVVTENGKLCKLPANLIVSIYLYIIINHKMYNIGIC